MLGLSHTGFSLINQINETVYADLRMPDNNKEFPLVLIMHGFKAWKDWGYFPYTAERIASSGAICINMSSSLCGVPDGADDYIFPEKFASNTVTRELADIRLILDSFIIGMISSKALDQWNGRIILLGHSRGGSVSIFAAAEDNRISKLIAWSPIERFVRFSDRQIREWKQVGYVEFDDSRTGTTLRIDKSYLDDFEKHGEKYNPQKRVAELQIPILFIHGKQDVTVPHAESSLLFNCTKPGLAEYELIDNTGHTFGIRHPFTETTKALDEVLTKTITFIHL